MSVSAAESLAEREPMNPEKQGFCKDMLATQTWNLKHCFYETSLHKFG